MTQVKAEHPVLDHQANGDAVYQRAPAIDISHIITEDDQPVDNLPSEKQQRFLAEPPYSSWDGGPQRRKFLVAANVGLFYDPNEPPLVPDVFLSMDVEVADEWWEKRHRSHFFWEFGKPPEIVIEIVSNREGGEADVKLIKYAQMGVDYYVIFDPWQILSQEMLRVFRRRGQRYQPMRDAWFPEVGLGLRLWEGVYEGKRALWLRWTDHQGRLILSGAERAALAQQQAEQAQQQAEQAQREAEEAQQQARQAQQRAHEAEQRAEQEAAARRAVEEELARLRAALTELHNKPTQADNATP